MKKKEDVSAALPTPAPFSETLPTGFLSSTALACSPPLPPALHHQKNIPFTKAAPPSRSLANNLPLRVPETSLQLYKILFDLSPGSDPAESRDRESLTENPQQIGVVDIAWFTNFLSLFSTEPLLTLRIPPPQARTATAFFKNQIPPSHSPGTSCSPLSPFLCSQYIEGIHSLSSVELLVMVFTPSFISSIFSQMLCLDETNQPASPCCPSSSSNLLSILKAVFKASPTSRDLIIETLHSTSAERVATCQKTSKYARDHELDIHRTASAMSFPFDGTASVPSGPLRPSVAIALPSTPAATAHSQDSLIVELLSFILSTTASSTASASTVPGKDLLIRTLMNILRCHGVLSSESPETSSVLKLCLKSMELLLSSPQGQ
jgi:hypothetical protein